MNLKNRLSAMIEKDKQNSPKYLSEILKSDFFYLISNYFEVNFDDIKVDISASKTDYEITICCVGDRIKLLKILPD